MSDRCERRLQDQLVLAMQAMAEHYSYSDRAVVRCGVVPVPDGADGLDFLASVTPPPPPGFSRLPAAPGGAYVAEWDGRRWCWFLAVDEPAGAAGPPGVASEEGA